MPHSTVDIVDFITKFENGDCDDDEIVVGFQALIDAGVIDHLQGLYQRVGMKLIESGACQPRHTCENGQCNL